MLQSSIYTGFKLEPLNNFGGNQMIRFFKSLFSGKKVREPQPEAPYKVEAPVVEAPVVETVAVEGAGVVEVPAKPKKAKAPAKPKAEKKPAEKKTAKPRAKKAAK